MRSKRFTGEFILPMMSFISIILIWELLDWIFQIREVILPNPHEILFALIQNFHTLIFNTLISMFEAIAGFILGIIIAFVLAFLFIYSSNSKKAFYPYFIALKAAPLYVIAPILILWFGNGILPKIVMSALVAFFPILVNLVKGLSSVDDTVLDLFKSYDSSKNDIFWKLRFMNSLPYLFPALKIASTLAVVGATIAEFTGASRGIGFIIVNSSYYLDTSMMFAAIIMISLGGILLFYAISFIEKKVVFWQNPD